MGTTPDDRDWLNRRERKGEMDAEQAFSMLVDIPSGPEADFDLRA